METGGRSGDALQDFRGLRCCYLHLQFSNLQKEIEERTNDIETLKGEQVKLQGVIKSLEKDIQGLKREIQERDETIQDKVKAYLLPFPATVQRDSSHEGKAWDREGPWLLGTHVFNLISGDKRSARCLWCTWHCANYCQHGTLGSANNPRV